MNRLSKLFLMTITLAILLPMPLFNISINLANGQVVQSEGKVAFTSDRDGGDNNEIYVMNADGSGQTSLTNNAAFDGQPDFSSDGTKIAFTSSRDGNGEIYVMNSDGSGQTRLTNNAALDSVPSWSPDGTKIAFNSNRDAGNGEIYVMNADGSGQTRLTNNAALDEFPDWSPDGSKVAFTSDRDGNPEIYVMNSDGSGQTRLTNNAASEFLPDWSPDGTKIAFVTARDGNDEIYVMNADGSGQTRLTNNPDIDRFPSWSPDGTQIAFDSFRDGNHEIYVVNADGSGQTNISNNPAADFAPSWSIDASGGPPAEGKIAFASTRDGNPEIYVMNSDGSGQTNISNNPADDLHPDWSPDGTKIAFVTARDGNDEIYVMNADGSGQTRLTNNPAFDTTPDWSPDGTKIAFMSLRDGGSRELYVMNADGSGQTKISPGDAREPSWSPDGTKIAFSSFRDGNAEVYVMNADGSGQTRLTNNPAADETPDWSPDGTKIAFASTRDGNREIYVMNSDGSGQTNVGTNPGSDGQPDFSPDGTKIALFSDRDGNNEIYVMNADGSGQTRLTNNPAFDLQPNFGPVAIEPDSDSDGVPDAVDNCPTISNPEQEDLDENGVGDACETNATTLILNDLRDVTSSTGFTAGGELREASTGTGVPNKLITFSGSGVTSSSGASTLQSVTTGGITFAHPTDPNGVSISDCSVPATPTPTTCTADMIGEPGADSSVNKVLRLKVGGTITFPAGTNYVKLYLQDTGTTPFKYVVTEANTPPSVQPEAQSRGSVSPIVSVLEITSGETNIGGNIVQNGIKEIEFTQVAGDGTVGISAILTMNTDGIPKEQHQINFEEFSAGVQPNPFEVNPGFFFSTGFAQDSEAISLEVTADFAGDDSFEGSTSPTKTYNVIANTAGIGGEGTQSTGSPTGTSITSYDCNTDVGSIDSDNDGICDIWETSGVTFGAQNYPLVGAVIGQRDLFVEVDAMSGFGPTSTDVTALRNAFAAKDIVLHIELSDTALTVANPLHVWTDTDTNSNNDFDKIKRNKFGSATERGVAGILPNSDYLKAKAQVYHYILFAKNINTGTSTACGPSGQAELNGNDGIVSLGCGFTGTAGSPQERQGTFMHELGHNLGLRHGGGDDANCKPNLISVMSYSRQVPWTYLSATSASSTSNVEWKLDYSRQAMASQNENSLSDGNVIPVSSSTWGGITSFKIIWGTPTLTPAIRTGFAGAAINWDGDSNSAESGQSIDINKLAGVVGCGTASFTTLTSYNEWSRLNFNFRTSSTMDASSPLPIYQDADTIPELTPEVLEGLNALGNQFTGVEPPVNRVTLADTEGMSVFKQGNVIPFKFLLRDTNGNFVTEADLRFKIAKVMSGLPADSEFEEITETNPASTGNTFRLDGQYWAFNLSTKNLSPNTTYGVRIYLNLGSVDPAKPETLLDEDGDGLSALFGLKK